MRARTAILISGRGSNMRSLIAAAADAAFPAKIVLVISNVAGAEGLKHAASAGIATKVIPHKPFPSREAFDAELAKRTREALGDGGQRGLVVLAGFMRILTPTFIAAFQDRVDHRDGRRPHGRVEDFQREEHVSGESAGAQQPGQGLEQRHEQGMDPGLGEDEALL